MKHMEDQEGKTCEMKWWRGGLRVMHWLQQRTQEWQEWSVKNSGRFIKKDIVCKAEDNMGLTSPICISVCNERNIKELKLTNRGCYGSHTPFMLINLLVSEQRSCNLLTTAITMIKDRYIFYQFPERWEYFHHSVFWGGSNNTGKCIHSCHWLKHYSLCHEAMLCVLNIERQVEESPLYWSV